MKVRLLKEVGIHAIGTILDVDSVIVLQLEKDGTAEIYTEKEQIEIPIIEDKAEPVVKRKGNPNWGKKQ